MVLDYINADMFIEITLSSKICACPGPLNLDDSHSQVLMDIISGFMDFWGEILNPCLSFWFWFWDGFLFASLLAERAYRQLIYFYLFTVLFKIFLLVSFSSSSFQLTGVNDKMAEYANSAGVPSLNAALMHTLQRHRDILQVIYWAWNF